jgi:hypothetical protein
MFLSALDRFVTDTDIAENLKKKTIGLLRRHRSLFSNLMRTPNTHLNTHFSASSALFHFLISTDSSS